MGVDGLFQQDFIEQSKTVITVDKLVQQEVKLGIDVSCEFYIVLRHVVEQDNIEERNTVLFNYFDTFCRIFREKFRYPYLVWVFDGATPIHKLAEKKERTATKEKIRGNILEMQKELIEIEKQYQEVENQLQQQESSDLDPTELKNRLIELKDEQVDIKAEITKKVSQDIRILKSDVEFVKQICERYGYPILQSEYESDCSLSVLHRLGFINGVKTKDSDLMWLGTNLYRFPISRFLESGGSGSTLVQCHLHSNVLKNSGWTHQQLIEYCFLVDTDFKKNGLIGLGHKRAREVMNKHGSILNYIMFLKGEYETTQRERDELVENQLELLNKCILKHNNPDEKVKGKRKPEMVLKLTERQQKALSKQNEIIQKAQQKYETANGFLEWFEKLLPVVMGFYHDDTMPPIEWISQQDYEASIIPVHDDNHEEKGNNGDDDDEFETDTLKTVIATSSKTNLISEAHELVVTASVAIHQSNIDHESVVELNEKLNDVSFKINFSDTPLSQVNNQ